MSEPRSQLIRDVREFLGLDNHAQETSQKPESAMQVISEAMAGHAGADSARGGMQVDRDPGYCNGMRR